MPNRTASRNLAAIAFLVAASGLPARADTFTATQLGYDNAMLSQFNLVNLGNFTTSNETEGRIVVGGNVTVNGGTNVCFVSACSGNAVKAVDASGAKYGALTVFGNLSGNYNTGNNGGDINVLGSSSGSYNLRGKGSFNIVGSASGTTVDSATTVKTTRSTFGGTVQNSGAVKVSQTLASVFPFGSSSLATLDTPLKALSKGLAALPGSPGVTAQALPTGNNIFFTANADYVVGGKKYGVVTTTLANLASEQNFGGINNNGNDATFVIVTGDGANYTLPNLNSYTGANRVIFDFVDATTLKFGGTWNGTILAPLATITQQGGVIDGTVVVASMTQSMELHQNNLFTGDLSGLANFTYATRVPEPASIGLLGLGLLAACWRRRARPPSRPLSCNAAPAGPRSRHAEAFTTKPL